MNSLQKHIIGNNTVTIHDGKSIKELKNLAGIDNIFIITNEQLASTYQHILKDFRLIMVPAGEKFKTQQTVDTIISKLLACNADKDICIVGLGGGVVTDLAGYVASVYKRGVRLVLIPTSVLCMVDACMGGKNGVNVGSYKNMVGTIYQPEQIVYDYSLLKTLSQEEWVSGFAEIIKHACIADADMIGFLEQHSLEDFQNNAPLMQTLVQRNVGIKMEVVKNDEREKNDRKLLNFGHTLGHAIEQQYSLLHGHAISIGMVFACKVSQHLGLMDTDEVDRVTRLLQKYQLPVSHQWNPEIVGPMIMQDKKRKGNQMQFVVLDGLGRAFTKDIDLDMFHELLKDYSA